MKTVQMTLDEKLLKKVDQLTKRLKTTRSAFTRRALQEAVEKFETAQLEERHREGYKKNPVTRDEFAVWEKEQVWGDE